MVVLRDVLGANLRIVFCGTAVGAASARRRAYYAGPGNAFWRTLHEVGLTPHLVIPEDYEMVGQYGLGLTDLAKGIAGADSILSAVHFDRDGLREKIELHRPRILAFTGKRAAEEFLGGPVEYGPLDPRIGDTTLFVLPSPSGAARRYWSVEPWKRLEAMASGEERA
jgi:double-stranded uracil-DNA glycosylase